MKKTVSVLIYLLSLLIFSGCGGIVGGNTSGSAENTVTVLCTEGIEVTSENPLKVKAGEAASFELSYDKNTLIDSVSAGEFNYSTGILTVLDVREDMRISVKGKPTEYDSSVLYDYKFMGKGTDTSSKNSGSYPLGVNITVNAGDGELAFVGWSIGSALEYGGRLVSGDREYSFTLTPSMLNGDSLFIYPNYAESNCYYYDSNGGSINTDAGNFTSEYYTAKLLSEDSSVMKVALSREYFEYTGCASTFYDDGIFHRSGYILTEYNTKPDGSGEGYSLGSKFPLNLDSSTLYCIWSKESDPTDFEYEATYIPLPSGVSREKAPHWVMEGIKITSYKADEAAVVIPEQIDGKTVTSIAEGAFRNKSLKTLVMGRRMIRIEDGAFTGCTSLEKIYYPDGIYDISNAAFDADSWSGVKKFYVNATLAPRFSRSLEGAYALKLSRLLYYRDMPNIIVIAGSSSFQGLSTEYLEALLDGEYNVVNFGTTRTTQGYMYLEAMGHYADGNDIVLFAPENSAYMMGEPRLYWKTLRDMEGMYNIFRYIDISNYENVLGAFAEFNKGDPDSYEPLSSPRYVRSASPYESIVSVSNINKYGEYQLPSERGKYVDDSKYQDVYKLTLNNRFKSIKEGAYMNSDPNEDYNTSENWCDITDTRYKKNMNRAITAAKAGGAKVLFTFCPSDALKLSEDAKAGGAAHFSAYDKFIIDNYAFDGLLGKTETYIYHHNYFYNNAFHLNDYGRTYRTYDMYCDLAALLGKSSVKGIRDEGVKFEGCLFELTSDSEPLYKASDNFKQ